MRLSRTTRRPTVRPPCVLMGPGRDFTLAFGVAAIGTALGVSGTLRRAAPGTEWGLVSGTLTGPTALLHCVHSVRFANVGVNPPPPLLLFRVPCRSERLSVCSRKFERCYHLHAGVAPAAVQHSPKHHRDKKGNQSPRAVASCVCTVMRARWRRFMRRWEAFSRSGVSAGTLRMRSSSSTTARAATSPRGRN